MNGSCPMIGAMTSAGLTNAIAAHQPCRISGNAQNIAATRPRNPSTIQSVTTQSPSRGWSRAAVNQGRKPYGNANAFPWPITGMWKGTPWPLQKRSLTHQTCP